MKSNHSPTFVPRGRQAQSVPIQFTGRPYTEDQDPSGRTTLTPRLSYASTPDSVFSTLDYSQNLRGRNGNVTRLDTTGDGREFIAGTERAMLVQHHDPRSYPRTTTVKRELNGSPLDDWLSEPSLGHSWIESPSIQAAHAQKQSPFAHDQPFEVSTFSTNEYLNHDTNLLSPNQVYAQHHNGLQQQAQASMFGPSDSIDVFMLPPASTEVNNPFHVDNNAFQMGFGQGCYNPHPQNFQGEFDFNNSPVYPTMQYAANHGQYDLSQAPTTLPTQGGASPFTDQQSSGSRGRPKASDLDDLLVKWRAEDVTYKDIMKRGDWGLSESTLRGRYRTLTKDKILRPRKPAWDNAALSALVTAVDRFAPPAATSSRTAEPAGKIPWKKVTEWMHDAKGTHKYGYATVKKKYEQLVGDRQMQREVNHWRQANGEHPFTR